MSSAKDRLNNLIQHVRAPAASGAENRVLGGVNLDINNEENNNTIIFEEEDDIMLATVVPNIVDLTLNATSSGTESYFGLGDNIPGTLKNDGAHRILHVTTLLQDEEDNAPLPSSNRFGSTMTSRTSGISGIDLVSARSSNTADPSVSWGESGSENSGNKYGVLELPRNENEFDSLCKRKIGNSSRMCIKKHCMINHRGKLALVIKGDILVQSSSDSVFLEPITNSGNVTSELLAQWLGSRKRLDEWIPLFSLANATEYHEVLTRDSLNQGTAFIAHAQDHKTSGMSSMRSFEANVDTYARLLDLGALKEGKHFTFDVRKRSLSDQELLEGEESNRENRRKLSDENFGGDKDPEVKIQGAVDHIFKLLEFLVARLDTKDSLFTEEIKILFSRVNVVHAGLGTQVAGRSDKLEAPTIWGSIAVLAGAIDEIQREVKLFPTVSELKNSLKVEFDRIEGTGRSTVNSLIVDLQGKISTFLTKHRVTTKAFETEFGRIDKAADLAQASNDNNILGIAEGAVVLKNEIEALRRFVKANLSRASLQSTGGGNCSNYVPIPVYDSKMELVDKEFVSINERIARLIADNDSEAIKSFGLGFRDRLDSEAFVKLHFSKDSAGLVLDAHLLLEHVAYLIDDNSDGTLQTLLNIKKLDLDNMTQGLCLMSFETQIPKILTKSSLIVPSKAKGITHFDRIATYADWDRQYCGTRDKIRNHIRAFAISHQDDINTNTLPDSKARFLATQALQTSVLWVTEFFVFIDNTYKGFISQSSFSDDKAWQLITQLGRRILFEISVPRNGVLTQLKTGDPEKLNKLVFWPILKSHDIMKSFKDADYQDHPTIAAEYVKFLAANSGTEGVDRLAVSYQALKEELAATKKEAKAAMASAVSASNAVDEIKKRLTKLEQNKR